MVHGDRRRKLPLRGSGEIDKNVVAHQPPAEDCFYIRVLGDESGKGDWYCYSLGHSKNRVVLVNKKKTGLISMLENDADLVTVAAIHSRIYKFGENKMYSSDLWNEVSFVGPDSSLVANSPFPPYWQKAPPMVRKRRCPKVASLNGAIYVLGGACNALSAHRNLEAEVLRPKSEKWELLSPLSFEFRVDFFFVVGCELLNMLVVGSVKVNLIYIYDVANRTVKNPVFMPRYYPFHPVFVGTFLIRCYGSVLYCYDLSHDYFFCERLPGIDHDLMFKCKNHQQKLVYVGDYRLCLICLEPDEDKSYLHFFEITISLIV